MNRIHRSRRLALILWVIFSIFAATTVNGGTETVIVKWVADGDTVLLSDKRLIRYIGIDTPEVATKEHPAEPLANAARIRNIKLIDGQPIRLNFDRQRQDRYGRTLAYVYNHRGDMLNEALVADGLAYCLPFTANNRHAERLLSVQQSAMTAHRGLWRRLNTTLGSVIGNRNSKRFHHPDCPHAGKISPKNRRRFPSVQAAFHAGFAPAKNCLAADVLFGNDKN